MQYRGQEFSYDTDGSDYGCEARTQESSGDKQYRRKRSIKATRRRTKSPNQPGCGIGARRNNRWTW
jgi:hypothetical protein